MKITFPDGFGPVPGALGLLGLAVSGRAPEVSSTQSTTTGGTSAAASTSTTGDQTTDATSGTSAATDGGDTGTSTGEDVWCYDAEYPPRPPLKVLLIVDTSASMSEPVNLGPGAPIVPWEEMQTVVQTAIGECLGENHVARAQFQLRLMPGPVGDDVCGRSAALDIQDWVSADEVMARLAEVVPQGGRAMRRALEGLPNDADLIVILSHGAPGCGDDADPELLDTQVAQTVLAQALSATIGHVALVPGTTPTAPDFEPDGVDAWQELLSLGTLIETECAYHLPLFEALSACPNLMECKYINPNSDPCILLLGGPNYDLNPNVAPKGDLDEVLIWVGDEPVPRVDACDGTHAWQLDKELTYEPFEEWQVRLCAEDLCSRKYTEGYRIQHSCNVDAPG